MAFGNAALGSLLKCWYIRIDLPALHKVLNSFQVTYLDEPLRPAGFDATSIPLSGSRNTRSAPEEAAARRELNRVLPGRSSGTGSRKKAVRGNNPAASISETSRVEPDVRSASAS